MADAGGVDGWFPWGSDSICCGGRGGGGGGAAVWGLDFGGGLTTVPLPPTGGRRGGGGQHHHHQPPSAATPRRSLCSWGGAGGWTAGFAVATAAEVAAVEVACVCSCPRVMRGDTVNHALTSTSSPPQ